jgi:hypothetical protein
VHHQPGFNYGNFIAIFFLNLGLQHAPHHPVPAGSSEFIIVNMVSYSLSGEFCQNNASCFSAFEESLRPKFWWNIKFRSIEPQ